jgi:hypothetical protein
MADIWVKVLTPAESYDILTLDELKTLLSLSLTDTSEDAQLQMWITQYSDIVATMCNRVFAYEEVQETWRGDTMPFDCPRLFLSHYPVLDEDIQSVESPRGTVILDPSVYELENRSGKMRIQGAWSEPVTVTYSGGYVLPDDAPPALKQATALLIQGAREQRMQAAVAGIKSITHRESRVQFIDPTALLKGVGGALKQAEETVNALLYKYMRIYV